MGLFNDAISAVFGAATTKPEDYESDMFRIMMSPTDTLTQDEKDARFWTWVGGAEAVAFGLQGGLAFPAGVTVGLMGYAGFEALQRAARQDEDCGSREFARKTIRLLFGTEGDQNSQIRRRLIDIGGSVGIAVLLGGATVTALMTGIAAGAALTLVTTWQKSADPDWFEEEEEVTTPMLTLLTGESA